MLTPLTGNYTYRELATDEFVPLFEQYRQQVFASELHFDLNAPLDADELQRFGKLVKNMGTPYRLHIGIYHDSEFVGWTTGWQRDGRSFYMANSGILPAHQGNGIYTALLPIVIAKLRDKGFQTIYSRHHPGNSTVLVPKLKAGFVITSFELSPMFGLLVHLTYFTNPVHRKVIDFRAGERFDDELRTYFDF